MVADTHSGLTIIGKTRSKPRFKRQGLHPRTISNPPSSNLAAGHYTAILSGKNGTTGVGLVEVDDISPGVFAELTNVSTRGFVGTGQTGDDWRLYYERRQRHYSGGRPRPRTNPGADLASQALWPTR